MAVDPGTEDPFGISNLIEVLHAFYQSLSGVVRSSGSCRGFTERYICFNESMGVASVSVDDIYFTPGYILLDFVIVYFPVSH